MFRRAFVQARGLRIHYRTAGSGAPVVMLHPSPLSSPPRRYRFRRPWETLWYTVRATLHGAESEYAVPVSKTNLSIPITPGMKKILKKMMAMKWWIFLLSLILLAALAGYVRYRGRKAKA